MGKILKCALLGAGLGGAVAAIQAYRRDEPVDVLATNAAKAGGAAAAGGATIGLLLTIRQRRRAKKRSRAASLLRGKDTALVRAADRAGPALEQAAELLTS